MANVLNTLVAGVEIDSTWGPSIYLPDPFAPQAEGGGVLSVLKPKITVHYRDGSTQEYAPYGTPGDSKWPILVVGLAAVLGLAVAGALLLRRK